MTVTTPPSKSTTPRSPPLPLSLLDLCMTLKALFSKTSRLFLFCLFKKKCVIIIIICVGLCILTLHVCWGNLLGLVDPVNMLDPIRKRFGYGQLWPLRPACSQNRARSYMPDLTSRISFSSVFPKKAWAILCKTDPDPSWTAWSAFCQTHLVWKQAGVKESSGPVSGRTQPARYQFPIFRLGCVLPQTSQRILYKISPDAI